MSKWKRTTLIAGDPLRSDILEMDGGLRLEVRQTKARSETSDRALCYFGLPTVCKAASGMRKKFPIC